MVMTQRTHLDDFLRGRIIGRLECERNQLEVSEEREIAQSVISRLSQRFQDDGMGNMSAEFVFMDDNFHPHHANIVSKCLQWEDNTRMNGLTFTPDLNPVENVWNMLDNPSTTSYMSIGTSETIV
ncbi:uncharacterized protein TNCV_4955991 [Trichonephila clavipes]|nr:uncharacterized protein TNCV_4955991 [Trichonephila clavipes]